MNRQRRKKIDLIIRALEAIAEETELVSMEEQDYLDNMPESFLCTEKAERAEDVVFELNDISDEISELVNRLENCKT